MEAGLILDRIEWDEANLNHATLRASAVEIEQRFRTLGKCTGTDRSVIESSLDHEPMAVGHLW
jgi:hypothetical protein